MLSVKEISNNNNDNNNDNDNDNNNYNDDDDDDDYVCLCLSVRFYIILFICEFDCWHVFSVFVLNVLKSVHRGVFLSVR